MVGRCVKKLNFVKIVLMHYVLFGIYIAMSRYLGLNQYLSGNIKCLAQGYN